MKVKYWPLAVAFCAMCIGCTTLKRNDNPAAGQELSAASLQPLGRYLVNKDQNLELLSSAAHVGFRFEGTQVQVIASAPYAGGHSYLQYEVDGMYQKRVRVTGQQDTLVITAPAAGKHTVWVYKTTEAHSGPLVLHKITGTNLAALPAPKLPLIEFIGNSITCGAAADPSEVPCGTGEYHDQHNAYMAYGPRVARALNASFVLSSVSGYGAYRNWNSNGPTLPQVYEKVDFQAHNLQSWDFAKFTPKIVSIALGTNDFSDGDGKTPRLPFDSAAFVKAYVGFVQNVKAKYPQASIALLSSPMMNGARRQTLENCLTSIKNQIDAAYPTSKPVALHFFKPMQASGCTGHPSVAEHGIMAAELEPFFRKLL
ncbi:GDSL-type esterase/lipase family protein [Rufibacter sediminis]|uniref:GDSL family lipase n=1 Tax=Rufibacter sediminis TaxID=2762756 RepID=A0ABR6VP81_9BACT|nr:SGNH/GDSL hydrolase family protein [Rufibacter sediminis]MBC3538732.1 GDSL family lipase [Rufibacter sediminis]